MGKYFLKNHSFRLKTQTISQLTFTCSKSTIETLEKNIWNMLKVNNKTPELHQWRRSGVFIVNFEHISVFIIDFKQINVTFFSDYHVILIQQASNFGLELIFLKMIERDSHTPNDT